MGKIYHYEPKIFGFKVVGKRGSKYFDPPKGNIRYNFDTMTGIDKEKIVENVKAANSRGNRFDAVPANVKALANSFADNFFVTESKDAETVLKEIKEEAEPRFDE